MRNFLDYPQEILTILVLDHRLGKFTHLLLVYPALSVGNTFKTGYLQSLTLLYNLNEG